MCLKCKLRTCWVPPGCSLNCGGLGPRRTTVLTEAAASSAAEFLRGEYTMRWRVNGHSGSWKLDAKCRLATLTVAEGPCLSFLIRFCKFACWSSSWIPQLKNGPKISSAHDSINCGHNFQAFREASPTLPVGMACSPPESAISSPSPFSNQGYFFPIPIPTGFGAWTGFPVKKQN
jgi:hypothetical protein